MQHSAYKIFTVCYAAELKTQYVIRIVFYIQLLQASDVEPQHLVVREGGGRDEGRREKQILHASQFQHVDKKKIKRHPYRILRINKCHLE